MLGYEIRIGECIFYNLGIVNIFVDLGIYDYIDYLFMDFYKGLVMLYL